MDILKQHSESPAGATRSEIGDDLARRWRATHDPVERNAIFREIFETFHTLVQRLFERRGLPSATAKDLVQEVMLKVHKGLDGFRGDTRFDVWLLKIAENVYKNHRRDRSAQKRGAAEVSLAEVTESGAWEADSCDTLWEAMVPDPLEELLMGERRQMLRVAIEALPPQERRCVDMLLGQELKYREIAMALSVETDTVKAHLFHARQKLRERLGPYFRNILDDPDQ